MAVLETGSITSYNIRHNPTHSVYHLFRYFHLYSFRFVSQCMSIPNRDVCILATFLSLSFESALHNRLVINFNLYPGTVFNLPIWMFRRKILKLSRLLLIKFSLISIWNPAVFVTINLYKLLGTHNQYPISPLCLQQYHTKGLQYYQRTPAINSSTFCSKRQNGSWLLHFLETTLISSLKRSWHNICTSLHAFFLKHGDHIGIGNKT